MCYDPNINRYKKLLHHVLIGSCFFALTLFNCGNDGIKRNIHEVQNDYHLIPYKGDSLTLNWIRPEYCNPTDTICEYEVYYGEFGSECWYLGGRCPATDSRPNYTLARSQILCDGPLVFAITAITCRGLKSDLHCSISSDAALNGGWYLCWLE